MWQCERTVYDPARKEWAQCRNPAAMLLDDRRTIAEGNPKRTVTFLARPRMPVCAECARDMAEPKP